MADVGKTLVLVGALLILLGGLLWFFDGKLAWFGNLPGDIQIGNDHFRFYFPITTMILVSLVLSGLLWLIRQFY